MKHSGEYFVHELDTQKAKIKKDLIGTYWWVDRYINRVGYMFDPSLIPNHEAEETAIKLLENEISGAIHWNNFTMPDEQCHKLAGSIAARMNDRGYPLPMYHAKGQLAYKLRKEHGEDAEWRRMWFVNCGTDFPHQHPVIVQLEDVRNCWTGKYYPASGGGYQSYDGEWDSDYEPGRLDPSFYQRLYIGRLHMAWNGCIWKPEYDTVLIHPSDLCFGPVGPNVQISQERP